MGAWREELEHGDPVPADVVVGARGEIEVSATDRQTREMDGLGV